MKVYNKLLIKLGEKMVDKMKNRTNKKNSKKWLIGLAIVIIALTAFVVKDLKNLRRNQILGNKEEIQIPNKYISYLGQDGKTVFELLRKNHNVEFSKSDMGIFINSVDGLENSTSNFWLYYVDGIPGETSADKFITKNQQKIEWRYESLPNY